MLLATGSEIWPVLEKLAKNSASWQPCRVVIWQLGEISVVSQLCHDQFVCLILLFVCLLYTSDAADE